MGLFSSIIGGIGSGLSSLVGTGIDFFGKKLEDKYINDPNSAEAYRRQKDFYQNRYQWMMEDMRKSGLNPILAAGSTGFSTGGTPQVQMSAQPRAEGTQSGLNLAQSAQSFAAMDKMEQEAKTEKVRQLKVMAEVKTEIYRKYKERNEAGLIKEQERRIWFEIERLHSETIKNLKEGFRTEADKRLIENNIKKLKVELTRLRNVDRIYQNPISIALSIIRELANSLGLNVGIIGKAGK